MTSALAPVSQGALMMQGYEPRGSSLDERGNEVQMMESDMIDSRLNNMPLEVYFHYAKIEREHEANSLEPDGSFYTRLFRRATGRNKVQHPIEDVHDKVGEKEKNQTTAVTISEGERFHAYRALRTASWQGVFFLITTDILGPGTAPLALSQLGYGGGVLVYFFLYIAAFIGGQILWRMYMEMDSAQYPIKCFADLGERCISRPFRHICNFIQSVQLLLNVALLLEGNAVTLATLINYKVCYVVLTVIWLVVGAGGGQIRSLRNFSIFANLNIFLNVVVILMTIIGCSIYAPIPTLNFPNLVPDAAGNYPPIYHKAFASGGLGDAANAIIADNWYVQVGAVIYAVFAYGGAMIFVEFMAEMRRPRDFWKAAFCAQTFIFIVYLIFGVVIYYFQGQYVYIIPSLNVVNKPFQLAVNIIGLFTTIIAACLYGNIGVKVIYINILQAYCRAPALATKTGRYLWIVTVCSYWILAFVLAGAIPNLSSMVIFVGAFCIVHFTYTFPPLMLLCYLSKKHAMVADRPWSPGMAPFSNRIDSWKNASRWKRGIMPQLPIKAFLFVWFLGALAASGLGCYAGIEGIIGAFAAAGAPTTFGCRAPGQPADTPTPP